MTVITLRGPDRADLAVILALFHCTDTEARDEALRLADEHCIASGHAPVTDTRTPAKTENEERANG